MHKGGEIDRITLSRTQTERTGDRGRPFQFNRSEAHQDRVEAHCKRVQREYFDSGLYHKEMRPAETERQREWRQVKRWLKSMEKLND